MQIKLSQINGQLIWRHGRTWRRPSCRNSPASWRWGGCSLRPSLRPDGFCAVSVNASRPARWPKTTSPFATREAPSAKAKGETVRFFFCPLFFAWGSGRCMGLEKSTRKLLFHPSESESRARMVHWVCGWFVVPESRNESSQIIHEWKVSSTSFVHEYFVPEIPCNFCGSSTFQYCASRPLSSPLANFCIFGGPCSSARDDWSCCEVECIFVYKNIKETRMFFFLKMCGYQVCVCWHHCLW